MARIREDLLHEDEQAEVCWSPRAFQQDLPLSILFFLHSGEIRLSVELFPLEADKLMHQIYTRQGQMRP